MAELAVSAEDWRAERLKLIKKLVEERNAKREHTAKVRNLASLCLKIRTKTGRKRRSRKSN
jgi:hypothetical protein